MDAYHKFDQVARTALSRYKVNVGTFYGRRETCTTDSPARFIVSVKGQGLPAAGLTIGRESAAEAVREMASQLKRLRRQQAEERDARDRARRQPESSTTSQPDNA